MYFKRTLNLAFHTYPIHLKSLLLQLAVVALVVAIVALFFFNTGGQIVDEIKAEKVIEQATGIIEDIVEGKTSEEDGFNDKIVDFVDSLKNVFTAIPNLVQKVSLAVWLFIILGYVLYFFFGMTLYVNMYAINRFMSTNVSGFYLWTYIKEFKNNLKINLSAALICMIFDAGVAMAVVGAYVMAFSGWGTVGIVVSVLLFIFLLSIRRTVLSYWIPTFIVEECGVKEAFKKSVGMMLDDFGKLLLKTFIVIFATVALALVSMWLFEVVWAGVIIILLSLIAGHYLTCSYLVDYYEHNHKTYFTKKVKLSSLTGDGENTSEN